MMKPAGVLTFDFEAECGPERRWRWRFCSNGLFYVLFFFKFLSLFCEFKGSLCEALQKSIHMCLQHIFSCQFILRGEILILAGNK